MQAQSYANIEHVIQDGGLTDGTLDILASHPDLRARLASERDGGIYDAINRAMARARMDVVGLMHYDDVFAHSGVLSQVAAAFADVDVDCAYGDLQFVSASDMDQVIRHWTSGPYDRKKLTQGWMPPQPTFYIRRSLLELYGNYDTSFRIAPDYDAILRWL